MRNAVKTLCSLIAAISAVLLVASGCAGSDQSTAGDSASHWLSEYGLDGLDGREIIARLDAMPIADRPDDLMASVKTDALVLSGAGGKEASLDLPDDEFYVSIAPYVAKTHDCYFHSLTTCVGELGNEDIELTITNAADGAVLVDDVVRTNDNGFAGFWLPRDIDANLTVTQNGRTATIPISTRDGDPTCITTAQLS